MTLQCAQCHDHPLVDDYKQSFYYGLLAFLNRSYLFRDPKTRRSVLAEKGEGEVSFQSVFDPAKVNPDHGAAPARSCRRQRAKAQEGRRVHGQTGQRQPRCTALQSPGPARRRAGPSRQRAVQRNFANRLWALMMGRGLVQPLDMDHGGNPPSHPELLTLLADQAAAHRFDVKWAAAARTGPEPDLPAFQHAGPAGTRKVPQRPLR